MAFESDNFMPNWFFFYQRLTFPHFYNYISNGLSWFFYSPNGFWPIIIVIEGNKNNCLNNFLINTSGSSKIDVGELEYRHKLLVLTKKKEDLWFGKNHSKHFCTTSFSFHF